MSEKKSIELTYEQLKGQKLSLTKKYNVKFKEDFGFYVKGQEVKNISEFAFKLYTEVKKVATELR